jgi:hypothetical protein
MNNVVEVEIEAVAPMYQPPPPRQINMKFDMIVPIVLPNINDVLWGDPTMHSNTGGNNSV